MSDYSFDDIAVRRGTRCFKWDAMKNEFGRDDLIPLWVADMDFRAPDFIRDAVVRRAEHGVYGYGIRDAEFWNAVIGWERRRNGWNIERRWLDFTPGVVAGFSFAIRAFSHEGGRVVIMPPVYPPFAAQIEANGRKTVNNPLLHTPDGWRIDFEGLDRALEGADAILLCNPHNPTGRVFTSDELERVGELCVKHNVFIISDEIHSDLIQKPYRHVHIAALSDSLARRTLTFIAPTKTFNIAGLSTSIAIAPDAEVRSRMAAELARTHVDQGNVFGTAALTAAYSQGDRWLDALIEYVGGNMRMVSEFFARRLPQVEAPVSEGTYLMWLDFRRTGMPHAEIVRRLTDCARVGLNNGLAFGAEGEGFVRMNTATSRALLSEALERIAAVF